MSGPETNFRTGVQARGGKCLVTGLIVLSRFAQGTRLARSFARVPSET